ncbi:2-aminoethylphosphonate---pyruvate transaminase [Synchytrium microbalum]|uniref:alanine--glyoxylate transaminase n=1 Tax=Synchytrium microbalum TaxID=1806994 RepID=A0A507C378_9FUNG|nr:2-aminoethylphosphonate---pyruvate transaminase [Synchytrium microbalum]TPX35587.1 2-aminoethylphosphonate---pyruvate transaminase [Synchytrium microbalum]
MSTPAASHMGPHFVEIFGQALDDMKVVFQAPTSQPYLIAGSGTLGWDVVATNFVEPGESVLILNTGLFGDRFGDCLETYGAKVTHLRSPFGSRASLEDIKTALTSVSKPYKAITITHIDTSSGVLSDAESISKLVHQVSPSTLVIVDAVCSAGAEVIRQDAWGLDVVLTGSQKALGAPPGLCVLMVSARGLETVNSRVAPPATYYASLKRWTPIMQGYMARKPGYFGTPPVQLITALGTSLRQIVTADGGMEGRWAKHATMNAHVKKFVQDKGLKLVPTKEGEANAMTAVYYPEGVTPASFLSGVFARGVQIAGGLHPDYATKYFRIGHMNVSAIEPSNGHVDKTLVAVAESLKENGYAHL